MNNGITEYFENVELTKEYDGYFCKISDVITISILGCICGLKNIKQIHQWASNARISKFLKEKFGINHVPCYYWMLSLLKIVSPESLNECFMCWVKSFTHVERNVVISVDGKTIRSTTKKKKYLHPLNIVSAQLCEYGVTLAQHYDDVGNEIIAVQELLQMLNIKDQTIVADALNCQKETAELIVNKSGNYLLCVKDNHPKLRADIEKFIQDNLYNSDVVKTCASFEKSRDREEERSAYVTSNINNITQKDDWANLKCIGAIQREVTKGTTKSSEWHYYISNRDLMPQELLYMARMEWTVETMHWLLDVDLSEDTCRVEDKTVQRNINMFRKISINMIKKFKQRKRYLKKPISNIMLDCLLDPELLLEVLKN